jgi:hypothetical protein
MLVGKRTLKHSYAKPVAIDLLGSGGNRNEGEQERRS